MEPISIKDFNKTPAMNFDNTTGKLEIKGISIPENSKEFYAPFLDWINQYMANPHKSTMMNIQLEYFNTSSQKFILEILKKIELLFNDGHEAVINWYVEENDTTMTEAGEYYQSIIRMPFNIIVIPEPISD